jgi:hypothetical protein
VHYFCLLKNALEPHGSTRIRGIIPLKCVTSNDMVDVGTSTIREEAMSTHKERLNLIGLLMGYVRENVQDAKVAAQMTKELEAIKSKLPDVQNEITGNVGGNVEQASPRKECLNLIDMLRQNVTESVRNEASARQMIQLLRDLGRKLPPVQNSITGNVTGSVVQLGENYWGDISF